MPMAWVPDAQAVLVHSIGPLRFKCDPTREEAMFPRKFDMKFGLRARFSPLLKASVED
jgi:hypothetical protein